MQRKRQFAAVAAFVSAIVMCVLCLVSSACAADAGDDLQRAEGLLGTGDYDAALSLLGNVVASDHSLAARATRLMAQCYQGKGQFQAALDALDQVISLYPEDPHAVLAKGDKAVVLMAGMHDYSKGRELLSELLSANAEHQSAVEWTFYLGMCDFSESNWTDARATLAALYTNYPSSEWHAQAKYTEAECCLLADDKAAARTALREVISQFKDTTWAEAASRRLASDLAE